MVMDKCQSQSSTSTQRGWRRFSKATQSKDRRCWDWHHFIFKTQTLLSPIRGSTFLEPLLSLPLQWTSFFQCVPMWYPTRSSSRLATACPSFISYRVKKKECWSWMWLWISYTTTSLTMQSFPWRIRIAAHGMGTTHTTVSVEWPRTHKNRISCPSS